MTPKRFGGSERAASDDRRDDRAGVRLSVHRLVHMLWTAHMWLLALFPPETQAELWSNPNTLAS